MRDPSSLPRDGTHATCTGGGESFFFGLNNKHVFSTVLKAKCEIKELRYLVSGDALFVEA